MNARAATRGEWQQALEQSIRTFNGDAVEAQELLDALIAGLKDRYGADTLQDVLHEFDQLKEALEELDRTTCLPGNMPDQDLREWLAESWHDGYEEEANG